MSDLNKPIMEWMSIPQPPQTIPLHQPEAAPVHETASDMLIGWHTALAESEALRHDLAVMAARAERAEAELDAARSEILTLRARLGNIVDLTTMPMPPDWTKKEG